MFDFSNKVIVVTGAAGNLGKAVVKEALNSNASVCGFDHKKGRLGYVAQDVLDRGAFLGVENINIKDKDLMVKAAKQVIDTFGKVDIVVNTVGGFAAGERVDQISSKTWQAMFDLNVQSVLNSAAAFVPEMEKGKGGKFIAVGSRASLSGSAKMGAYAASKGALLRLIECMAEELKPSGIQVNCVLPGTIDTPENRKAMPNADTSSWVSPKKVAQAILFLASPMADAVTGTALPVYGC